MSKTCVNSGRLLTTESASRIWAAVGSLVINLLLWALLLAHCEGVFWWMIPGLMPAFFLGAMFGHLEGELVPILGYAIVIVGNFGFYYMIFWVLINIFTPSTNWWPEKHT